MSRKDNFCVSWRNSTGTSPPMIARRRTRGRWRELKRHIVRMKDALDLARIELDRKDPEPAEALKHVRWGLGEDEKS